MIIPIDANVAYQQFNIQLGAFKLQIKISWVTRHEYFIADLSDITSSSEIIISKGRVLHLGVDLLGGNIRAEKYGTFIPIGVEPTITNIGTTSGLNWTPA